MSKTIVKFTIDGNPASIEAGSSAAFEELLHAIQKDFCPPGHAVSQVSLNGEDRTGAEADDLAQISVSEVARLEIKTAKLAELAAELSESLNSFIEDLTGEAERVAKDYRRGDDIGASEGFTRLIDGIRVVMHARAMIERNLSGSTKGSLSYYQSSDAGHGRTQVVVEEMLAAIERRDMILLADLIEYELIPHLEAVARAGASLRESAYVATQ